MEYKEERNICEYLGLMIESNQVHAWYGGGFSDGGRNPIGWVMVCHISKLKMYLCGRIHREHYKKLNTPNN